MHSGYIITFYIDLMCRGISDEKMQFIFNHNKEFPTQKNFYFGDSRCIHIFLTFFIDLLMCRMASSGGISDEKMPHLLFTI